MRIILAPNAFKGSATASEAAAAMARGVRRAVPDCETVEVPVADGGDGLYDVLGNPDTDREVAVTVTGPRFTPVETSFVMVQGGSLALIEMARASGLALLSEDQLDPTRTTTVGTGELIRAALDHGARQFIIGIGGSATNDGGAGAATALGWRFLDAAGAPIHPVGGELDRIATIDGRSCDPRLAEVSVTVACDVDNPLCGPRGAAAVYGPQKGATTEQVAGLDRGLAHLADVVAATTGIDHRDTPGVGAAGGLGFGLLVFAGGRLRRGTDVIFDQLAVDRHIADADLVMTGEGRIDEQTSMGKAPAAVAACARAHGVPCIALGGSVDLSEDARTACGFDAVHAINPPGQDLTQSMADVVPNLEHAATRAVRAFLDAREGAS